MDYDIEDNEMWDWQGTSFCLQESIESSDMSKCVWSDMKQHQDVSYILGNEITPVKDCGDLAYYVNNYEEKSEKLEKLEEPSSQVKRRRMLHFDSEGLNAPFCNEDTSSSYLRSKVLTIFLLNFLIEQFVYNQSFLHAHDVYFALPLAKTYTCVLFHPWNYHLIFFAVHLSGIPIYGRVPHLDMMF